MKQFIDVSQNQEEIMKKDVPIHPAIQRIIDQTWENVKLHLVIDDIQHIAKCADCQKLIREGKVVVKIERQD